MKTNPDTRMRLSPKQFTALDSLILGNSVSKTAEQLGVARQTVSEWLNQDAEFRAELNRRRAELWSGVADRMRALVPRAIGILEGEIDSRGPMAVSAAVHVLKATGLYGTGIGEIGPTDARDILQAEKQSEGIRSLLRDLQG